MVGLCRRIADSAAFQRFVTLVILFAGVLVGIETWPEVVARHAGLVHFLDRLILAIFVFEIGVKMVAHGRRPWDYFRDPWNVFDFTIVAVAFLPLDAQYVTVLRLLRLLRVIRLVRALPRLQILVTALLKSIPSMAYVGLLLALLFYVYGVAATFLFGRNDPVHFGQLPTSLLTLFQIVTLEGWTDLLSIQIQGCDKFGYDGIAHLCTSPEAHPAAAIVFFVTFILLGTMIMLNLFIGVIMNGMEEAQREAEAAREIDRTTLPEELGSVARELQALQEKMLRLQAAAAARPASTPAPAQPAAPKTDLAAG